MCRILLAPLRVAMPLAALAAQRLQQMTQAQRNGLAAEALALAHARQRRGQPWVLPTTVRVRIRTPGGIRVTLSVGGAVATQAIAQMRSRMKCLFAVRLCKFVKFV